MIHIYGTSHVSEESLDVIDEAIERHDPEFVALELDLVRLEALTSGEERGGGPIFMRLLKWFQDYIGSRTGLMPGEEMLYAYSRSMEDGREVVLIDQDIRVTVQKINRLRRKEKVRAVASILLGLLLPFGMDVSRLPDEDEIEEMVEELQKHFPGFHRVMMEERNEIMIRSLRQIQDENPGKDIVAFVGAAHRKPLREALEE